jgi:hypothetical protein
MTTIKQIYDLTFFVAGTVSKGNVAITSGLLAYLAVWIDALQDVNLWIAPFGSLIATILLIMGYRWNVKLKQRQADKLEAETRLINAQAAKLEDKQNGSNN